MIKIFIVDNSIDIINYFTSILEKEDGFCVVGNATSGAESVAKILEVSPDIVLMDIQMETMTAGIEAVAEIRKVNQEIKFAMLTIHLEDDLIFQAYTVGAMDYIIKTASIVQIINSIRNIYTNTLYLRPEIATKLLSEFVKMRNNKTDTDYAYDIVRKLTNSEFEVLKLVAQNYTYRQIADMRYVTEGTIKLQANNILKKTGEKKIKNVVSILKNANVFNE